MTSPYFLSLKTNYNYDLTITNYDIKLSVYSIPYAEITFFSENIPVSDLLTMLKRENQIELVINGINIVRMIPLQAEILEDNYSIKLSLIGYIGDLFRTNGYYIRDGAGYIDFTREVDGIPVGVYAYSLAVDVLKHTHFGLRYAPAITYDDKGIAHYTSGSVIYVRGDWLTKTAWMYTIAANTYFGDYTGDEDADFTTDMEDPDVMVDCCNTLLYNDNTISIGVAGCEHIYKNGLPTNLWKKKVVNITDYITSEDNTVFKFINFDNAVVQGGSGIGATRDTYVAHPITVDYLEPFNYDYDLDKLTCFGSGSQVDDYQVEKWSLAWGGGGEPSDPFLYLVSANTSEEHKEEFASVKNLWLNLDTGTVVSVDLTSQTDIKHNYYNDPNDTVEDKFIYNPYSFTGVFMGYDNPEYEPNTHPYVNGYFFGIYREISNNPDGSLDLSTEKTYFMVLKQMIVKHAESGDTTIADYDLTYEVKTEVPWFMNFGLGEVYNMKVEVTKTDDLLRFDIGFRRRNQYSDLHQMAPYFDVTDPEISSVIYPAGEVGVFSFSNTVPEIPADPEPFPSAVIATFDNLYIKGTSETLFGDIGKPVIFAKNKALNNNVQGKLVAKSILAQQNVEKEITVGVNPTTIFDMKLEPGMWVQIDSPKEIAGEHRVVSINMTPDDIKLNLNKDTMRFTEYVDGLKENINILDSFSASTN